MAIKSRYSELLQCFKAATSTQPRKYSVVGVLSNLTSVGTTFVLGFMLPFPIVSGLAFVAGGQVTFWGNYLWTYRDHLKTRLVIILPLFLAMNWLLGLVVNRRVVATCLDHFVLPDWWPLAGFCIKAAAYVVAGLITFTPNVAWNHYVIFRHNSDKSTDHRNEDPA